MGDGGRKREERSEASGLSSSSLYRWPTIPSPTTCCSLSPAAAGPTLMRRRRSRATSPSPHSGRPSPLSRRTPTPTPPASCVRAWTGPGRPPRRPSSGSASTTTTGTTTSGRHPTRTGSSRCRSAGTACSWRTTTTTTGGGTWA